MMKTLTAQRVRQLLVLLSAVMLASTVTAIPASATANGVDGGEPTDSIDEVDTVNGSQDAEVRTRQLTRKYDVSGREGKSFSDLEVDLRAARAEKAADRTRGANGEPTIPLSRRSSALANVAEMLADLPPGTDFDKIRIHDLGEVYAFEALPGYLSEVKYEALVEVSSADDSLPLGERISIQGDQEAVADELTSGVALPDHPGFITGADSFTHMSNGTLLGASGWLGKIEGAWWKHKINEINSSYDMIAYSFRATGTPTYRDHYWTWTGAKRKYTFAYDVDASNWLGTNSQKYYQSRYGDPINLTAATCSDQKFKVIGSLTFPVAFCSGDTKVKYKNIGGAFVERRNYGYWSNDPQVSAYTQGIKHDPGKRWSMFWNDYADACFGFVDHITVTHWCHTEYVTRS